MATRKRQSAWDVHEDKARVAPTLDHGSPGPAGWHVPPGGGEDPLTWSVPLAAVGRVRVRLHVVFVLMVAAELALAVGRPGVGVRDVVVGAGAVLAIVIAREFCRAGLVLLAGGAVQAIVVWPGGALTDHPAQRGLRREAVSACGAVVFGMLAWPALAMGVWASGLGWDQILFNPFGVGGLVAGFTTVQSVAWWLYAANAAILAFNLLVPAPPADAARMLACALRGKLGEDGAAMCVARVGLVAAATVFVAATAGEQARLMGLGVLTGVASWLHLQRVAFRRAPGAGAEQVPRGNASSAVLERAVPHALDETEEAVARRKEGASADGDAAAGSVGGVELDSVLERISRDGLGSLDERERAVLERETRRRRGG